MDPRSNFRPPVYVTSPEVYKRDTGSKLWQLCAPPALPPGQPDPTEGLIPAPLLESCRLGIFPQLITILIEPVQPSFASPPLKRSSLHAGEKC